MFNTRTHRSKPRHDLEPSESARAQYKRIRCRVTGSAKVQQHRKAACCRAAAS